jgi:hypothetical protein
LKRSVSSKVGQGLCSVRRFGPTYVEFFKGEVRRNPIPRTPVNRPLGHASGPPGGIIYDATACEMKMPVGKKKEEEGAAVSSEQEKNKALARRFLEATSSADLDAMDEMMAPSSPTAA